MLVSFDAERRCLEPCLDLPRRGWIHAVDPSEAERDRLREGLGVPSEVLRHALDLDEIARVDRFGETRLVILRVPMRGAPHEPFRAGAVAVVVTNGALLTISRSEVDVFDGLLAIEGFDPDHHARFVLHLLLATAERFLGAVREIDRVVAQLEEELQQSLRNREVYELLRLQKSLVHFTTALASDRLMVERLRKDPAFAISGDDVDLLEDALVELQQASEVATVSANILGEMMDAFASIISNNLNVVMKVLTALTLLITLPTLAASFYGMNVRLPGQHHPWAFAGLLAGSVALSGILALVLMRKQWL